MRCTISFSVGPLSPVSAKCRPSTKKSPRPSLDSLQYRAGRLLQAGIASNTQLAYTTGLNAFEKFRVSYSLAKNWPATQEQIVLFIAYCFEVGLSPKTITTYLAGVNYFHKLHGWIAVDNCFVAKKMLEGCHRSRKAKDLRAPISCRVLMAISTVIPETCYSEYESTLFRSLFTTAYFGLFRVSELVAASNTLISTALTSENICIDQNSLVITLQKYKTNQRGDEVTIKLPPETNQSICPVHAVKEFIQMRPKHSSIFFCHANGTPVTRQQFSAVLAKCLGKTSYASGHYKSHSFRIGRASDLAAQGLPMSQIMKLGRWQSMSYKLYIRK